MFAHRALAAAAGAAASSRVACGQHSARWALMMMMNPAAISTTSQASCQKRPALQVRQDGKDGALGGGYCHRHNVNQRRASFSSLSAAAETAVEEKSGEQEQEEEEEKEEEVVKSPLKVAHTIVTHPPAPGWKYPRIPGGLEAKFAVFKLGSTQHKVTKDDVILAEKVKGAEIGTTLEMHEVLLVGTPEDTIVGRPLVAGASVKLYVEEQVKDKKIIVFKKRRRKSSKTTKGHRREVTMLRVIEINSDN